MDRRDGSLSGRTQTYSAAYSRKKPLQYSNGFQPRGFWGSSGLLIGSLLFRGQLDKVFTCAMLTPWSLLSNDSRNVELRWRHSSVGRLVVDVHRRRDDNGAANQPNTAGNTRESK
jgi:hypothetical protein